MNQSRRDLILVWRCNVYIRRHLLLTMQNPTVNICEVFSFSLHRVTIHGLADKENPAVIDSGVFAWLIVVPVYF